MKLAAIECANDHDAGCVEQMIKSYIVRNQRGGPMGPESIRFCIERLIEDARRFNEIKRLLSC